MKRSAFYIYGMTLGVALSLVLAPISAMAQSTAPTVCCPDSKQITTQGHGEVKVRPDSLTISVSVESKDTALIKARSENNRKMQTIIAALKGLNIPAMKLETQGLNVFPIQGEYQKDKLPKTVGYQANNSLNVSVTGATTETLGEIGSRIVDTALNAGANNVGGLNFFLADMSIARGKALELAVKDARHNADAMARAAEITLTGVASMEGSAQFGGYPRPMPMYAMKSGMSRDAEVAQTPVETGETTVTSDVTIRFKF